MPGKFLSVAQARKFGSNPGENLEALPLCVRRGLVTALVVLAVCLGAGAKKNRRLLPATAFLFGLVLAHEQYGGSDQQRTGAFMEEPLSTQKMARSGCWITYIFNGFPLTPPDDVALLLATEWDFTGDEFPVKPL